MQQATHTSPSPSSRRRADVRLTASTILQIAGAALLGVVLLYGVGFASMGVAHNAAHDARHAFAFPCH